jgi:uncharacterized protein
MISIRLLGLITLLLPLTHPSYAHTPITIHTLYGSDTITEPVLIELLESKAIQRLHHINQYGIMKFIKPEEIYTRYQHSVGVLYLLRRYGASLAEQVMGLLHDVSHTAFSHVADFLFDTVQQKYSYQDTIFEWFICQTDLHGILERHNFSWICDSSTRNQFKMLKDDLPNLCADRLEYNLYGGYLEGILTETDIMMILNRVEYRDASWIFTDCATARMFADTVLYLSKNIWCADWNCFIYSETAKLLKHTLSIELITKDDLIFSDDATIWNLICSAAPHDEIIQQHVHRILDYQNSFTHGTPELHDYTTQGKFRWIDPLVITEAGPKTLSGIDRAFADEVQAQKKRFREPHYIRYLCAN